MKKKTITAEVIKVYRVDQTDEYGDDYDSYFRTKKAALNYFESMLNYYGRKAVTNSKWCHLSVGKYNDYFDAVRKAEKADDSPVGCGAAAIPPWKEIAMQEGAFSVNGGDYSDISLYLTEYDAVRMPDGTYRYLEEFKFDK